MNETTKRAAGLASVFSYIFVPMPRQTNMLMLSPEATSFCDLWLLQSLAFNVEFQCVPLLLSAWTIYFLCGFDSRQPAVGDCFSRGMDKMISWCSNVNNSVILYHQIFFLKSGWKTSSCFYIRIVGGIFWNMVDRPVVMVFCRPWNTEAHKKICS